MATDRASRELDIIAETLRENRDLSGILSISYDKDDAIANPLIAKIIALIKEDYSGDKALIMDKISRSFRKANFLCDKSRSEIRVRGAVKIYHVTFVFLEEISSLITSFTNNILNESFPFDSYKYLKDFTLLQNLARPEYLFSTPKIESMLQDLKSLLLETARKVTPRVIWEISRTTAGNVSLEKQPLDFNISIFNNYSLLLLTESLIHLDVDIGVLNFELRENFESMIFNASINPENMINSLTSDYLNYYSDLESNKIAKSLSGIVNRKNTNGMPLKQERWQKNVVLRSFLRNRKANQHYIKELIGQINSQAKLSASSYLFLIKMQMKLLETICILIDLQYSRLWPTNNFIADTIESKYPSFFNNIKHISWQFDDKNQFVDKLRKIMVLGNNFLNWHGIKEGFEHWYPKKTS
ncbi:MAG: hypothetical protein ACXAEU_18235 [Candidatus Hodarchaeales archaeon]|jgi:hypothetical protein